jgi:transposase
MTRETRKQTPGLPPFERNSRSSAGLKVALCESIIGGRPLTKRRCSVSPGSSSYARLSGKDRRFIKGHKYTLLSRTENLTLEGRQALRTLLRANKRLNTAYLLKESFDQLWSYKHEAWARRFFDNWRVSLKWQRLKTYEKFADMIDSHWAGIAAYCKPENRVSLGFVEGLKQQNPSHPTTRLGTCGRQHSGWYDRRVRRVRDLGAGDVRIYLEFEVRRIRCRQCGKVKSERLEFLANNPHYSKRFALYVGRSSTCAPNWRRRGRGLRDEEYLRLKVLTARCRCSESPCFC